MSGPGSIQAIPEPDLRRMLQLLSDEIFASLNCHQPGTIASFDATKQTAQVTLNVKRTVYNQTQQIGGKLQLVPTVVIYPILVDVPIFTLSGGPAMLTMPITEGDPCLVLFSDRDIDTWFDTGSTDVPNSPRMHDLSDGMAIVGFRSLAQLITSYATDAAELRYLTTKLRILGGGALSQMDADVAHTSANGGKVEIRAIVTTTGNGGGTSVVDGDVTHTSASGGVIAAKAKLDLHNSSGSLKSALDSLITALTSWIDTHGDTPTPATVTALNAVKTSIDALLQ